MRKLEITVDAENEDEALKQAVTELGENADNLVVMSVGNKMYMASVVNVHAEIRISVSEDEMTATIDSVQPSRGDGTPLDRALLETVLGNLNIVQGIDFNAFEKLQKRLAEGKSFKPVVIAQGVSAEDGANGNVTLHIRKSVLPGTPEPHDRIDFHEREYIKTVVAGQLLATVSRATNGAPGKNIYGKPIVAKPGTPAIFKAAEHTVFSEDHTEVRSEIDGMVTFVHGVLAVTDVWSHSGDIDYETGNIHMKKGSVLIRGSIHPGFSVDAAGNVVVTQSMADARIRSGADVEIREGVVDCVIEAEGTISMKYAQNCRLKAGGDIIVANNLHNCDCTAGNQILVAKGKGVIRGGESRSTKGVIVKVAGSEYGTHTRLAVKCREENERELLKERAEINEALWNISLLLGKPEEYIDDKSLSIEEKRHLKKVLIKRNRLKAKRTKINSILHEIAEARLNKSDVTISILEQAYPGTEIYIHEKRYIVKSPVFKAVFQYSVEEKKIVVDGVVPTMEIRDSV